MRKLPDVVRAWRAWPCLVLLPSLAFAAPPRTDVAEADIDAIFARYDRDDTPGCSVAVVRDGAVVFKKSYGMADPSLGVPMQSTTSSWIPYSEARVFVALAVASLAREGRFGLDDPVRRHVPEVPDYAAAVTVRQLLHHTSGLADYGVLAGPGYDLGDRLPESDFFRMLQRWGKLGFEPGTREMYSNTDYALLKILVERVTGGTLHEFVATQWLEPLGMASTRIGFDQAQRLPGHALFHDNLDFGGARVLRYRVSPVGGISLTTSVDDLVRWEAALRDPALGIGGLLRGLEQGAPPREGEGDDESFAFGVYRFADETMPRIEYRGVGGYSYLVHVPSKKLSVATLCNVYGGVWSFGPAVARLYAAPAQAPAVAPAPAPLPATPSPAVDVPLSELQALAGGYRDEDSRIHVDVAVVDGALVVTPRGRGPLPAMIPLGGGEFEVWFNGSPMRVRFEDAGQGMVMSSRDPATGEPGGPPVRRRDPWMPSADALATFPGTYVGENVEITLHVRVAAGEVVMGSRGFADVALQRLDDPDHFALPDAYRARFERDAGGRVVAVVLDATRVQGMRFVRQE